MLNVLESIKVIANNNNIKIINIKKKFLNFFKRYLEY